MAATVEPWCSTVHEEHRKAAVAAMAAPTEEQASGTGLIKRA
jgi:hypothetical protein